jgi:hypothetical protein
MTPVGIIATVTAPLGRFWRRPPVITLTDAHDRAALAAISAFRECSARGEIDAAHRWADLACQALRGANAASRAARR